MTAEIEECSDGHELDPKVIERAFRPAKPGGFTHSSLTPSEQGQLAERVVRYGLKDLKEFGVVNWWSPKYHSPLDGATDRNWAIEVKSASNRTRNLAFVAGKLKTKKAKDKWVRDRGYRGVLCIMVVLNFETSMADIYVRAKKKVGYYAVEGEPFATVPFENTFVQNETLSEEPLPF